MNFRAKFVLLGAKNIGNVDDDCKSDNRTAGIELPSPKFQAKRQNRPETRDNHPMTDDLTMQPLDEVV